MDWNLKTPAWDISEFQQETSLGGEGIKEEFSVDLKLGHVANAGSESGENSSVPRKALVAPGSSKRARAVNSRVQAAYCLVDGCNADLSGCREYHRRHKVCEMHSKAPEVTIGGLKQRFCQQCSRFHSLEEFDEGKRSCRKRLEGHNRRRRKPQPDPFSHPGTILSNYQDTRLFPFSSSEAYPTRALTTPVWLGDVKTGQDAKIYNQQLQSPMFRKPSPYPGPSSSIYREEKPSSFMLRSTHVLNNQVVPETSSSHQFYSSSESTRRGHQILSPSSSTQLPNSNCALSLLSSLPILSSEISISHMAPPPSIQLARPFGLSLQNNALDSIDSVLVPNAGESNVQGMFQMGQDLTSTNEETSRTLPFCWE